MKKEKKKGMIKGRSKSETRSLNAGLWLCLIRGIAVAFAITCIIFIGFGILLTYTSLSEDTLPVVSLVSTALSAAAAGYDPSWWAACMKKRGLFWGMAAGAVYGVLLFLVTGLAGSGFTLELSGVMTLVVALAGGGIGGILGINRKG